MGRPRGFDPDAAVQTAMTLFWRHGYDAVSLDMLVSEISASRKGLYALWPDKQALFVAALKSYGQMVSIQLLQGLESEDAGLTELSEFWRKFENAARQPGWSGCLVVRTSGHRIADEPDVAVEIGAFFDRLSSAFESALCGAVARGEIAPDPSPQIRARQAFSVAVACSAIGAFEGFTPRIADLIAAGRATCGCQDNSGEFPAVSST